VLAGLALAALVLPAHADEVKKWTDAAGNLHYSITGSDAPSGEDSEAPILQGRQVSAEETFSVEASLRRKEIETKLVAAAHGLEETRAEIATTEKSEFKAWVPNLTGNAQAAQSSLDAQRDAFLAAAQFQEEKTEKLRRLRRQERGKLKEIVGLWKEFSSLDGVVTDHFGGTAPEWWRRKLSCPHCPTLAEAERDLHPKASQTPSVGETAATDDEDWGDDDEDWQ